MFERANESSNPGSNFRMYLFLTIIGGIGILAIFLPFSLDISAFRAASDFDDFFNLWKLAWPFFLPVFIAIASLRWLIAGSLSRPERLIAYLVSAVSAVLVCISLSSIIEDNGWPPYFQEGLMIVFPIMTLGFGIFYLIRTRHDLEIKPFQAIMSMQTAYLANGLLCLIGLSPDLQIGAYCSLVTVLAYLTQIILVLRKS